MSDLSDFLREKKAEYENEQVNWDIVKIEWIQQLHGFMNDIKNWIEQPRKEGLIDIVDKEIEITEEHIGKYTAPSIELIIGAESVRVTPVGRFIIGASGRVDITSFIERFIILYHSEKGWIYRNEQHQTSFQKFTEANFTKILKDLV